MSVVIDDRRLRHRLAGVDVTRPLVLVGAGGRTVYACRICTARNFNKSPRFATATEVAGHLADEHADWSAP